MATSITLALTDAAVILASIWLGVYLWGRVNAAISMGNYFAPWLALAVFLGGYASFGLYAPAGLGPVEELRRTVTATALFSLLLTAAVFLSKSDVYSRGAFLTCGALLTALIPLVRSIVRARLSTKPWWGVPVVILGAGETGGSCCAHSGISHRSA